MSETDEGSYRAMVSEQNDQQVDTWAADLFIDFAKRMGVGTAIAAFCEAAGLDARGFQRAFLVGGGPDHVVGIDTAGRVSVANSGIQHLLGYERDELVGEPFHRLLKASELLERTGADTLDEAFDILVRGLGRDGETRARDWTWMTKGGGEQLVSMTLSVAQDAFAEMFDVAFEELPGDEPGLWPQPLHAQLAR